MIVDTRELYNSYDVTKVSSLIMDGGVVGLLLLIKIWFFTGFIYPTSGQRVVMSLFGLLLISNDIWEIHECISFNLRSPDLSSVK